MYAYRNILYILCLLHYFPTMDVISAGLTEIDSKLYGWIYSLGRHSYFLPFVDYTPLAQVSIVAEKEYRVDRT